MKRLVLRAARVCTSLMDPGRARVEWIGFGRGGDRRIGDRKQTMHDGNRAAGAGP